MVSRHSDATVKPLTAGWGIALELGRQHLPTVGTHDGFYYALLGKGEQNSHAKELRAP